jgi:hypothetical protein
VLTPILANDDPYEAAAVLTELAVQPWGEQAFHAVVSGYRFLIAAGG